MSGPNYPPDILDLSCTSHAKEICSPELVYISADMISQPSINCIPFYVREDGELVLAHWKLRNSVLCPQMFEEGGTLRPVAVVREPEEGDGPQNLSTRETAPPSDIPKLPVPNLEDVLSQKVRLLQDCPLPDPLPSVASMQAFSKAFHRHRISLKCTQGDIVTWLKDRMPAQCTLSQSLVSRFESLDLSVDSYLALRPLLQSWIDANSQQPGTGTSTSLADSCLLSAGPPREPHVLRRMRKPRTVFSEDVRQALEKQFSLCMYPSTRVMHELASEFNVNLIVVQQWFANRRKKIG